ncbi:hypothetical protein K8I28_09360, partial [bacterium]|nr:hypothetical protein [bacterium]
MQNMRLSALPLILILLFSISFTLDAQEINESGNLYQLLDDGRDIVVQGDFAYIANWEGGVRIFDVSDPADPLQVGIWIPEHKIYRLDVQDEFVYAVGQDGLVILNVSIPAVPHFLSRLIFAGLPDDVEVSGDYAYVTVDNDGLYVVDISDPATPEQVGNLTELGNTHRIHIQGNLAFITLLYEEQIAVVDLSTPWAPTLEAFYEVEFYASDISVDQNLAIDVTLRGNISFRDISDFGDVNQLGFLVFPPFDPHSMDIDRERNIAVTADGYFGIQFISYDDPANPQLLADIDTNLDRFQGVDVKPELAYFCTAGSPSEPFYEAGQLTYDYTDPENPLLVGAYRSYGRLIDIELRDNIAFLLDEKVGLRSVDISDPGMLTELDSIRISGRAWDFQIHEGYAWVGMQPPMGDPYIQVVDISNPENMELLGSIPIPTTPTYMSYDNGFLAVARRDAGVMLFNVRNPIQPVLSDSYETQSEAEVVLLAGELLYTVDESNGL